MTRYPAAHALARSVQLPESGDLGDALVAWSAEYEARFGCASEPAMVEVAGRVLAERLDLEMSPYPPASASDTWTAPIDLLTMAMGGDS